jgi:signal transduction histidine kinase
MAATVTDLQIASVRNLPEALARTLRHEIGDFLQKVYASVAILESRLPAEARLDREILTRLRNRAEACKHFLDAVQDFLSPLVLNHDLIDLAQLSHQLVDAARGRHPRLDIVAESNGPAFISADMERMLQVGDALLTNACEAARGRVVFSTRADPDGRQVEWSISDDGPGVAAEAKGYLFRPFFTTRPGHAGLGLALAQKLVSLHGGRITVGNLPQGGCGAHLFVPASDVTQTIPLNEDDTRT